MVECHPRFTESYRTILVTFFLQITITDKYDLANTVVAEKGANSRTDDGVPPIVSEETKGAGCFLGTPRMRLSTPE